MQLVIITTHVHRIYCPDSLVVTTSLYLVSSPCQLLPLEVYQRQELLVEVAGVSDSIPEDAVQVCQFTFDLEQWLIPTLEEVFTGHSLSICSLTDYDVQLVEVIFPWNHFKYRFYYVYFWDLKQLTFIRIVSSSLF